MTVYRCPLQLAGALTRGSGTVYLPVANSNLVSGTPESDVDVKFYGSGWFDNFRCNVSANAHDAATVVTLRKNGSGTSCSITIGAGLTGQFEDSTHNVAFADGDMMAIDIVQAGTGNVVFRSVGADLLTATPYNKVAACGAFAFTTASVTRYFRIPGNLGLLTSLTADAQVYAPVDGFMRNLAVKISANARSTSTVFTIQNNGSDTSLTVTVGAGLTGIFEDTTNEPTFAAGDGISGKMDTSTGSGAITCRGISIEIESDDAATGSVPIMLAYGGGTVNQNQTRYVYALSGMANSTATSTTDGQIALAGTGTIQNLYTYVLTNTAANSTVMVLRENTTDQAVTITISATTTGLFSDTTNSFTYADGDLLQTKYSRGGSSSGSYTAGTISYELISDSESDPTAPTFVSAWAANSNTLIYGAMV